MFLRVIAVTTSLPFPHCHQVHVKNLIAVSSLHCPIVVLLLSPVVLWGTGTCGDEAVHACPFPPAERGLGEEQEFWLSKERQQ